MALLHNLSLLNQSGMTALRVTQRDWSPYLVHFTSWSAMKDVRAVLDGASVEVSAIADGIRFADKRSHSIARLIIESGVIEARQGSDTSHAKRVCLSECNLPGLMGHVERFGRFGFVFDKQELFRCGGRPCVYVDNDRYGELVGPRSPLLPFANVYRPFADGGKIQDYMVEREWRILDDIPLTMLKAIICPDEYYREIRYLVADRYPVPIFPIDMLYAWGV